MKILSTNNLFCLKTAISCVAYFINFWCQCLFTFSEIDRLKS